MDLPNDIVKYIAQFIPLLYLSNWILTSKYINHVLKSYTQGRANNFTSPYFKYIHKRGTKEWFARLYLEANRFIPVKYICNYKMDKLIVLTNDTLAYRSMVLLHNIGSNFIKYIVKYAKEEVFNIPLCNTMEYYIKYRRMTYFTPKHKQCQGCNQNVQFDTILRPILAHSYNEIDIEMKSLIKVVNNKQIHPSTYNYAILNNNPDALQWLHDQKIPIPNLTLILTPESIAIRDIGVLEWLKRTHNIVPNFSRIGCLYGSVIKVLHEQWPEFNIDNYLSRKYSTFDGYTERSSLPSISLVDTNMENTYAKAISQGNYYLFTWLHQNKAKWPSITHWELCNSHLLKYAFKNGYKIESHHQIILTNKLYYSMAKCAIKTKQIEITPTYIQLIRESTNVTLLLWLRDHDLL